MTDAWSNLVKTISEWSEHTASLEKRLSERLDKLEGSISELTIANRLLMESLKQPITKRVLRDDDGKVIGIEESRAENVIETVKPKSKPLLQARITNFNEAQRRKGYS